MNAEHLQILRHSLGLDIHGRGKMYRNHYCDRPDRKELLELVELGLMFKGRKINEDRDQYFHVSDAGKAKAVEGVKPLVLTRSQRRYRAFLHADNGMTFREWLQTRWAKECL